MNLEDESLERAELELEGAYRLFNWSTDPRITDEAIQRIRVAEMQIDRLTHDGNPSHERRLPWVGRRDSLNGD